MGCCRHRRPQLSAGLPPPKTMALVAVNEHGELYDIPRAKARQFAAPSPLPTPSLPPPLPTTTGAAPPPAASSISPRRQQLWPSYGCRCRRHACRCGPLRWLPPLGCCSRCLAVPMLAGCSCLSCWWLAAAWSCAQKLHWNAWMHGNCLCLQQAWVAFDKCHSRVRHFAGVFIFPYKMSGTCV